MDGLNLASDTDPVEKIRLLEEEVCEPVLAFLEQSLMRVQRNLKRKYRSRAYLAPVWDRRHRVKGFSGLSPLTHRQLLAANC